jgi:hypothetical protein
MRLSHPAPPIENASSLKQIVRIEKTSGADPGPTLGSQAQDTLEGSAP